jgi:hypothetical protein
MMINFSNVIHLSIVIIDSGVNNNPIDVRSMAAFAGLGSCAFGDRTEE